jgi:hypothetical protein
MKSSMQLKKHKRWLVLPPPLLLELLFHQTVMVLLEETLLPAQSIQQHKTKLMKSSLSAPNQRKQWYHSQNHQLPPILLPIVLW